MDYIENAKNIFDTEINALLKTREVLDDIFVEIVNAILQCKGKVILCGIGKSGHIAKKISATHLSTYIPRRRCMGIWGW